MISNRQVSREVGMALIYSYGAVFEILLYFTPMEVVSMQILNRFMYRVGVSRCQMTIKFPVPFLFTYW